MYDLIRRARSNMPYLLTPITTLGMISLALIMLSITLIIMYVAPTQSSVSSASTAALNIIPASTITPPLPTATLPPLATSTEEMLPSPLPGVIGVGAYVQVNGTGVDGLRVREGPSLSGKTLFVAIEAEVFQIIGGPRDVDGYTWWQLLSPSSNQQGWAVVNYLMVIQNP